MPKCVGVFSHFLSVFTIASVIQKSTINSADVENRNNPASPRPEHVQRQVDSLETLVFIHEDQLLMIAHQPEALNSRNFPPTEQTLKWVMMLRQPPVDGGQNP